MRAENLTGKVFNKVIVLRRAPDHVEAAGGKVVSWLCQCVCGKRLTLSSRYLKLHKNSACCKNCVTPVFGANRNIYGQ